MALDPKQTKRDAADIAEGGELREGQVYQIDGQPALYVRTERGEHLFAVIVKRAIFLKRYPETGRAPNGLEPVTDSLAIRQVGTLVQRVADLTAERNALAKTMRSAVALVPVEVASHLRKEYGRFLEETRGEARPS